MSGSCNSGSGRDDLYTGPLLRNATEPYRELLAKRAELLQAKEDGLSYDKNRLAEVEAQIAAMDKEMPGLARQVRFNG